VPAALAVTTVETQKKDVVKKVKKKMQTEGTHQNAHSDGQPAAPPPHASSPTAANESFADLESWWSDLFRRFVTCSCTNVNAVSLV
jgi:hypothetical protein